MSAPPPNGVTIAQLRNMIDRGERVVLVDVRTDEALRQSDAIIPGAITIPPDALEDRRGEIPQAEQVVVYASAGGDAEAAEVARRLMEQGWQRVHPLLGGFEAWRDGGHPVVSR